MEAAGRLWGDPGGLEKGYATEHMLWLALGYLA